MYHPGLLAANPTAVGRAAKGRLTILFAARDREHNSAALLAELLRDS